jgi:hypothetical protein
LVGFGILGCFEPNFGILGCFEPNFEGLFAQQFK